jgi:hypothetical protein
MGWRPILEVTQLSAALFCLFELPIKRTACDKDLC